MKPLLEDATKEIIAQRDEVARLKTVADKHPFYKYNGVWTRELQNLVTSIELCAWLGGLEEYKGTGSASFLTIEEVGKFLNVPVNLKEQDAFHLTIEEYLLALIGMVEELVGILFHWPCSVRYTDSGSVASSSQLGHSR
jgi:hypothetical protein